MFLSGSSRSDLFYLSCAAGVWLVVFTFVVCFAFRAFDDLKIDSNILNLLPGGEDRPLVIKAQKKDNEKLRNSIVCLVGGRSDALAFEQSKIIKKSLQQSGLFDEVKSVWANDLVADRYKLLSRYRYNFLSEDDRDSIEADPEQFAEKSIALLYSPLGIQRASTLMQDPVFTLGDYINTLDQEGFSLYKDSVVLRKNDRAYILLLATVSEKGKNIDGQLALVDLYKSIRNFASEQKFDVLLTGFPLYSAYGAKSAKSEISSIGIISITAIIILTMVVFRSPIPLVLSLLSIVSGVLAAIVVCSMVFGRLHVITLVFGSSLIGISVDYAFHYFCESFSGSWNSRVALSVTFKSITLGMLSSVIAFFTLSLTPFNGLQQIGVFSATGLLFSWLTVVLLVPFLSARMPCGGAIPFRWFHYRYQVQWPAFLRKNRFPLLFFLLVISFAGFSQLKIKDDIRLMQNVDVDLRAQEDAIGSIFGDKHDSRYFLVSGKTPEDVFVQERALLSDLDGLVESAVLGSYTAISQYYQDEIQQKENYERTKSALFNSGIVERMLNAIGVEYVNVKQIYREINESDFSALSLGDWLKIAPENIRQQWLGCENEQCASVIHLAGIEDAAKLARVADGYSDGVYFVDNVAAINKAMSHYRVSASFFIGAAAVLILIILAKQLTLVIAARIVLVPLASFFLTLATLSLMGVVLNLFTILALLLVLGVGIDYAIFHCLGGSGKKTTSLAVLLSMLTTLLAFGLLSLSETNVIRTFGQTIALGVFFAFVLSPLVVKEVTDAAQA